MTEPMFRKETESYEFGEFRLDMTEHFLARLSGERVQLSEKAFETLCILVQNSGHLVNKTELLNQVWADSFVEENNLDKCIYAIRRALGEKPGERRFIETVRKHGYRFVVEVRRIEEEVKPTYREGAIHSEAKQIPTQKPPLFVERAETQNVGTIVALEDWRREADKNQPDKSNGQTAKLELAPTNPLIKSRPKYRALVVAGLIIGAIGLSYYFFSARKTASGMDGKKSIAVLPLKPINTANRDELYEIGIADSLIHRLSSMKGFVVRPLNATRKYADIGQDPLAAGQEQKVDYVLASNYQLAGGKIRITAQLFNLASGQIEETYTIEKNAGDVFAMQNAIAGEVGNLLLARFGGAANSSTAKRGTTNEEAYRLYLQGMYLVDKLDPAEARKGVGIFEQAVRLDPSYAKAWVGKAQAHRYVASLGRSANIHEEYQKSMAAVNKALALDENLVDAQSALCEYKLYYEWDFAGAARTCQRAIELDPNSSIARQIYSHCLLSQGRSDDAIAEIKTAIDLEPTSLFNQLVYGIGLYYARRYEEANVQFKRVISMNPNFGNAYPWLWQSLEMQEKYAEAFEWFMKFQALQKRNGETVQFFQTAYQTSGWQGILREQVRQFEAGNYVYFHGAGFNAKIGNKDKAFEYLEKSYKRREKWMSMLNVDPSLDSLRDDPRFDELVRRVGLK